MMFVGCIWVMQYIKALSCTLILLLSGCQQVPLSSEPNSTAVPGVAAANATSQSTMRFHRVSSTSSKPVVALVLGSGGARGYAHIGVIEVLEGLGIRPDFIVGTSAGSIVGSIYASGKSAQQLHEIAVDMKANDVREFKIGLKGFFDGVKIEDYVNKQVGQIPLEQLKIPMYVVATELKNGNKVVFNHGNTRQAVRASVTIPSMFVPTIIDGKEYVDGGLVSPVPVNIARELGADVIIAVDILAQPKYTETSNIWGLFNQNINIMQNKLAEKELKNADIVIVPDLREKAHIFDVKGREETIRAGMTATEQKRKEIETVLQRSAEYKALEQNTVKQVNSVQPNH